MTARPVFVRHRAAAAGVIVVVCALWGSAASAQQLNEAPAPPPSARTGPAPLVGAGGSEVIKGRYIVVLKKGSSVDDLRSAREQAQGRSGRVEHEYRHALVGFSASLPAPALEALRHNPRVDYIEGDGLTAVSQTAQTQLSAPWSLDRVDQRTLPLGGTYSYAATGLGVKAYVIDTGIRSTHSDFEGRVTGGYTAVADGAGTQDCNGHGTHVAGTIGSRTYGVAKRVQLVPVRTLDCSGSGPISGVIAGIDWVTADHGAGQPAVANMSLGGTVSAALDTAVANSIADGITYAVAAGNSNADACTSSPARVTAAITVGATTSSDSRSSFSNYGGCLDLFAPGSTIASTWHTSDTATNTISGTSMATPHVAGAAALYLQANPSAPPSTVASILVNGATPNVVSDPGVGSPNRLLYSLAAGGGATPAPTAPACSLPEAYTGSLSGTGAAQFAPNGTYFYSRGGTHKGCLRGPAGTDFDLSLLRWNGIAWLTVAQGRTTTANEDVTYVGTSGYYVWLIESHAGAGAYTFRMQRP